MMLHIQYVFHLPFLYLSIIFVFFQFCIFVLFVFCHPQLKETFAGCCLSYSTTARGPRVRSTFWNIGKHFGTLENILEHWKPYWNNGKHFGTQKSFIININIINSLPNIKSQTLALNRDE